ncbi:VOC family protein [Streptomyces profundus]|uniref:VOC family protein n=1 Tax=Streptomyces profundus TaxID=2867410 RepID=UPI001D16855F|nr:VOC family protein [Streptomyces sp. MA3_2.13]UED86108.1 VOC family protein [Streptomyces sp. MA3_2.13]
MTEQRAAEGTPGAGPDVDVRGGVNIAMKIPAADYAATVAFYRETLGLEVIDEAEGEATGSVGVTRTHAFRFGPTTLWLDQVDGLARSDLWLELRTSALESAVEHLAAAGHRTCDEIEPFVDPNTRAHWIRNPAGVVHVLAEHQPEDEPVR